MKKLLIISAILLPLCAWAQDLSTEVVVDRTVAVELPEASPIPGVGPALAMPQRADHGLSVSDYTMTTDFTPSATDAVKWVYTGVPVPPATRGYAWLGYFPAYNLGAGVGYKVLNSDTDRLDVSAGFEGASWHGIGSGDTKPSQRYNTVALRGNYRHVFKSGLVLSAKAAYSHDGLRVPYFSPVEDADAPQSLNHGAFEAGIRRDGTTNYSAKASFRFFSVGDDIYAGALDSPVPGASALPGASDKLFNFDGHIGTKTGDNSSIRLGVNFGYLNTEGQQITDGTPKTIHPDLYKVGLNPAFDISLGEVDVRLGIHTDLCKYIDKTRLHVSPDVAVVWHAAKWGEIYVAAGGGQKFNTLGDLYDYSVFAPGFSTFAPMWTKVDGVAGIRVGSFGGFSADIHAGYAASNDVPVVGLISWGPVRRVAPTFVARNITGWHAGAKFTYKYSDILTAYVEGEVYTHGRNKGYMALRDNARATLGAGVEVKPIDRFSVSASYKLRACRFAYIETPDFSKTVNLRNVSDLGLGATYRFDDKLAFFLRAENLLCRRYLILPGIQSRRLHGLVGASYSF